MLNTPFDPDLDGEVVGTIAPTEAPDSTVAILDHDDLGESRRARVVELSQRCADLRSIIHKLTQRRAAARASLAESIAHYGNAMPRLSPLEVVREFQRRSNAERARTASGFVNDANRPTPGPSRLDATCLYGAGGDADDHLRRRMKTGHRRGSFSAAVRGAYVGPK